MDGSEARIHEAIAQLQRLTELFQQRRAQLARAAGLTEQQWKVMEEISTEHFIPSLFARNHASSAPAVSKVLRQLQDKGLITVSVSEDDGRQRRYELTEAGRRTMDELRALRHRAIEVIWSQIEPRQLEAFTELSRNVAERIEAYAVQEPSMPARPQPSTPES